MYKHNQSIPHPKKLQIYNLYITSQITKTKDATVIQASFKQVSILVTLPA